MGGAGEDAEGGSLCMCWRRSSATFFEPSTFVPSLDVVSSTLRLRAIVSFHVVNPSRLAEPSAMSKRPPFELEARRVRSGRRAEMTARVSLAA